MPTTRSMTGFARATREIAGRDCALTVKSVNHKALDVQLHLPPIAEAMENEFRQTVRKQVNRGYVQVSLQVGKGNGTGGLQLNEPLFRAWLAAYHRASYLLAQTPEPQVDAALRMPGMLVEEEMPSDSGFTAEVISLLEAALAEHREFREREGTAILEDFRQRTAIVRQCADQVKALRAQATSYFSNRLRQRLDDLLEKNDIDPQRLAQEVALLADKTDVSEELTRLVVHIEELEQLIGAEGEIGKKLDFLLQEMNREANTLLAKTANTGEFGLRITKAGLTVKAEIEKMREQALNLE
ncbi:MAG: YicC/YloC family endoribonuclease [Bryobacterales bacterium]|nr:YicC/YloC family endoribonuclease [Bryobacterales bacterium]